MCAGLVKEGRSADGQTTVLNMLTDLRQFDKVKILKKKQKKTLLELQVARQCSGSCAGPVGEYASQVNAQHMVRYVWGAARWAISRRSATAKEAR